MRETPAVLWLAGGIAEASRGVAGGPSLRRLIEAFPGHNVRRGLAYDAIITSSKRGRTRCVCNDDLLRNRSYRWFCPNNLSFPPYPKVGFKIVPFLNVRLEPRPREKFVPRVDAFLCLGMYRSIFRRICGGLMRAEWQAILGVGPGAKAIADTHQPGTKYQPTK